MDMARKLLTRLRRVPNPTPASCWRSSGGFEARCRSQRMVDETQRAARLWVRAKAAASSAIFSAPSHGRRQRQRQLRERPEAVELNHGVRFDVDHGSALQAVVNAARACGTPRRGFKCVRSASMPAARALAIASCFLSRWMVSRHGAVPSTGSVEARSHRNNGHGERGNGLRLRVDF